MVEVFPNCSENFSSGTNLGESQSKYFLRNSKEKKNVWDIEIGINSLSHWGAIYAWGQWPIALSSEGVNGAA